MRECASEKNAGVFSHHTFTSADSSRQNKDFSRLLVICSVNPVFLDVILFAFSLLLDDKDSSCLLRVTTFSRLLGPIFLSSQMIVARFFLFFFFSSLIPLLLPTLPSSLTSHNSLKSTGRRRRDKGRAWEGEKQAARTNASSVLQELSYFLYICAPALHISDHLYLFYLLRLI